MTPRERHLLKSYGITQREYDGMLSAQRGVCAVCGSPPKTRSLHVDHEHVKGFKKMDANTKKRFIRGLLCFQCNWIFLSRGISLNRAKRIVEYLRNYELRNIHQANSGKH